MIIIIVIIIIIMMGYMFLMISGGKRRVRGPSATPTESGSPPTSPRRTCDRLSTYAPSYLPHSHATATNILM